MRAREVTILYMVTAGDLKITTTGFKKGFNIYIIFLYKIPPKKFRVIISFTKSYRDEMEETYTVNWK